MSEEETGILRVPAQATLFGFEPTPAELVLLPRSRRWRTTGALRLGAIGVVLAPVVAILPPHAPWALGALALGGILARRRYRERFTVQGVEGVCPRCQARLNAQPGRLKDPHPVPCEGCHNEVAVRPDDGALPGE